MIRRHGLRNGVQRATRQLAYRRESRRLSPLVASAARGFAADLNETMARYELALSFSNVWADARPGSPLIPHVRLRDFEAPMARAAYLTGYSDELAEFYEIGREIDAYRCAEELADKTRFYLKHPAQAEALREAGYRRARRDHTWTRRFEQLFDEIGCLV
jgi:spore maturation protein CgeB